MNSRSLYKLLLTAIAALSFTDIKAGSSSESALVINEIMPANIDMFLDPSYNYGNWIEIYNPGNADVDISGWYLSNDTLNNRQCPLGSSSRIVKAGGFLTLWMDHYDDYCQQQIEFFDFKYDNCTVILSDRNGNTISRVDYKTIPARISYARKTDGALEWGLTGTPTPGKSNNGSEFAANQIPAPVVSVDSKLFTQQFYFNVTIPDGATLYYTKDGSTPTPQNPNAKTSNGSHTVSETSIYRFRLYKEGMLPSPVTTRSYICTGNSYGIPVVSVVTARDNLYGTEYGIWAKGPHGKSGNGQSDLCNWNRDWDRPVNIEVIDATGRMVINQEAEITPSGRYSRAFEPRPFKVKAKKRYGYDNYFAFTPFSDKPYNKYQSFKMRGGGNNFTARLKDAALQQIIIRSGLNADCQSYQPVHHYINGEYKGVINIREPNNKDFAYSNYGFEDDEVDCFKLDHNNGSGGLTLTEGSRVQLDEWVRLSASAHKEESYRRICQIVDIDEFVNYMAIEFFLANQDWPRNNIKAFKHNTDGRYRFVVFDLDHSFGSVNQETDINPFTFFDSEEYYTDADNDAMYKSAMVTIFHGMLRNSTFRKKFIDSFCIVAGSVFDPSRVNSIVNELAAVASREMAFNNESPMNDADLITRTITSDYRLKRTNQLAAWSWASLDKNTKAFRTVKTDLPQAVLTLNGQPIPTGQFNGYVFMPAKVTAQAPVGYTFIGWKDNTGNIVSTEREFDLSQSYSTLTASFTTDSRIKRPVRINEISADNGVFINDSFKKHDWIELYNTTQSSINIGGMYLSDDLKQPYKYQIPSTVIPADGYLIIWCDKDDGSQLHAPFKLKNEDGSLVVLTADDWADTLIYNKHSKFQSVGLYPDAGNRSFVMNLPSIGKKNKLSGYDNMDRDWITGIRTSAKSSKDDTIYNPLGIPVSNMEAGHLYISNGRMFYYHP